MISLILTNLFLISFLVLLLRKRLYSANENSILKHLSILEIAWMGFLFILGLFYLFDAVEAMGERDSILEIAGKERLTLLSVVVGFIIIHLSLFMAIVIRCFRRSKPKF